MRRLPHFLLAAALSTTLCATGASALPNVIGQVPDRVLVTLKPEVFPVVNKAASGEITVDIPSLHALGRRFRIKDMSRLYPELGAPTRAGMPDMRLHWAVDFPPEFDLDEVIAAYAAAPEVARVEAVDICPLLALPNDPGLSQQWYMRNTELGGKDIRALGGWAQSLADSFYVIAIIDSGVDWQHPDLGGSGPNYLTGAIKINWVEWMGVPGVDDDENGRIDDFRGWDFVTGVTGEPGQDLNTPDNDPMDFEGHGTGCAGVAAAITNNNVGIAGAAWGGKILPVRVGWLPLGAEIGVVRMDFASQGMIYAANTGAKIINCSWGSTSALASAVSYCQSLEVMIVTAAGNDNNEFEPSYLSTHPYVISVAATTGSDSKADFSNFGTWVEISAPGAGIYTTWYNGSTGQHLYSSVSGTSFASPLTAGAIALLWSAHPAWGTNQVKSLLYSSADNIDAINPTYAGKLGAGRVNLLRALGDRFHKVPTELPTLLDAMNEAAVGDTIALRAADGLDGPVTIISRALNILGGYNGTYTSRDPVGTPTVITANAGSPALLFQSGTGAGTVVDGFRCTGGGGQSFATPVAGRYGGGVVINGTSPTLRRLDITGNAVGGISEYGGGGGIFLNNSTASLIDVAVHGNTAIFGAGIFVYGGSPTFSGCEIYDNTPYTGNFTYTPSGGGLYVQDATVTLDGCRISGHTGLRQGGGIFGANFSGTTNLVLRDNEVYGNTASDKGGGLYFSGGSVSMRRDSFHDNGKAAGATYMTGGGFMIENATATLDSVLSRANTAHSGAGGAVVTAGSATIRDSRFLGGAADFFGGGLTLQGVTTGLLAGNTIASNSGVFGAGGVYVTGSGMTVQNNIFAFNTGGASFANGFNASSSTVTFSCNDAFGNAGASYGGVADPTGTNGNIALDPLFCDVGAGNYGLQNDSPCAPANSGGCGLIGALGAGCGLTPVPDDPIVPALLFRVEPNTPNPFNPATTIRFTLPASGRVTVRVFDVAGRLVRTLVDEERPAGAQAVEWNGCDAGGRAAPSGVYFFQVRHAGKELTGRMALIK